MGALVFLMLWGEASGLPPPLPPPQGELPRCSQVTCQESRLLHWGPCWDHSPPMVRWMGIGTWHRYPGARDGCNLLTSIIWCSDFSCRSMNSCRMLSRSLSLLETMILIRVRSSVPIPW